MNIANLMPGVSQTKLIIGGIILAGIIAFIVWVFWMVDELGDRADKIDTLESNVKTLQDNTNILRQNYLECHAANTTNAETITALLAERDDAKKAVELLAQQKLKDGKYIDSLEARIGIARRNPTQNGPVAPVLRETIRDIQENSRNE